MTTTSIQRILAGCGALLGSAVLLAGCATTTTGEPVGLDPSSSVVVSSEVVSSTAPVESSTAPEPTDATTSIQTGPADPIDPNGVPASEFGYEAGTVVVVHVGDRVDLGGSVPNPQLRGDAVRENHDGVYEAVEVGQSLIVQLRPPCGGPEEVYPSVRIVVVDGQGSGQTVQAEGKRSRGGTPTTILPQADSFAGSHLSCG